MKIWPLTLGIASCILLFARHLWMSYIGALSDFEFMLLCVLTLILLIVYSGLYLIGIEIIDFVCESAKSRIDSNYLSENIAKALKELKERQK